MRTIENVECGKSDLREFYRVLHVFNKSVQKEISNMYFLSFSSTLIKQKPREDTLIFS